MGVYQRGNKLWICYRDAEGTWQRTPTGLSAGQERLAERLLATVESQVAAGKTPAAVLTSTVAPSAPPPPPGPPQVLTVAEWNATWSERRKRMASWKDEECRLRVHVLPEIGHLRLDEVKPRHIIALSRKLQDDLAPRTVRVVYAAVRVLFRDAVVEELIPASPCVMSKDQLGKLQDKNPEWRAGAVYTRTELEQLISDARVPFDRRVLYAFKGLAGLRDCEVDALRWRQWDRAVEPLTKMDVFRTKTGQPRRVPVHPVLATLLAEWKLSGWAQAHGRPPKDDDLILPREEDAARERDHCYARYRLVADLTALGLRQRRGHDLRRTMISLARADGARRDVLEAITHGTRGNIMDVYTEWPWASLCEAVACLKVTLRAAQVVAVLPAAVACGGGSSFTVPFTAAVETEAQCGPAVDFRSSRSSLGGVASGGGERGASGTGSGSGVGSTGGQGGPGGGPGEADCEECCEWRLTAQEAVAQIEAGRPEQAAALLRFALRRVR